LYIGKLQPRFFTKYRELEMVPHMYTWNLIYFRCGWKWVYV